MSALPANFTTKVMESTCTVWTGSTNNKGYGIIQVDGRLELAHRVAYEAAYGPIPDGMVIDHVCRVRNCVKPEHLEPVTVAENNRRGRHAAALKVGDVCINGHVIAQDSDLYHRPTGAVECCACRASAKHREGRRRPTRQRRADTVKAAVYAADSA